MTTAPPPYSGSTLDRHNQHRGDDAWLSRAAEDPSATALVLHEDLCLTRDGQPVAVALSGVPADLRPEAVLLGTTPDAGVPLFALDLGSLEPAAALDLACADGRLDLRGLFPHLAPADAAALAQARGLLRWHRDQRHCGRCGATTRAAGGGSHRQCTGCHQLLFPRIEPAVITLVETSDRPPRVLLARHAGSRLGKYSLLAGFVEVGESLEDAVRRELREEVGLDVGDIRYVASQPWPFPAGIMVAFRASARSTAVAADGDEVTDARWFTAPQLRRYAQQVGRLGRADSVDRMLLDQWLGEQS